MGKIRAKHIINIVEEKQNFFKVIPTKSLKFCWIKKYCQWFVASLHAENFFSFQSKWKFFACKKCTWNSLKFVSLLIFHAVVYFHKSNFDLNIKAEKALLCYDKYSFLPYCYGFKALRKSETKTETLIQLDIIFTPAAIVKQKTKKKNMKPFCIRSK